MENKALKIVGTTVIIGGLMAAAFLAGGLSSGGGSSAVAKVGATATATAKPALTATPKPIVTLTPLPGDGEDEETGNLINEPSEVQDPGPDGSDGASGDVTPAPVVTEEPAPGVTEEPPPVVTEVPPVVTEQPVVTEEPEPPVTETPEPVAQIPSVMSMSPADGATGVDQDTVIRLTFSQPMDKANVQAAFSVNKGNPGTFSWNGESTVMTFTPGADYAYGDNVAWELSKTATDTFGTPMSADEDGIFKVIRQSTVTLNSQGGYDGQVKANFLQINGQFLLQGFVPNHTASDIRVSMTTKGFVSFDLSGLPEDLVMIQEATIRVYQDGHDAAAYSNTTGRLMIESYTHGSVDATDWQAAPHPFCEGILCPIQGMTKKLYSSSAANGWKVTEVTTALWGDWEHRAERGERSQFRLSFEKAGPMDIGATFGSGNAGSPGVPELEITYLHP